MRPLAVLLLFLVFCPIAFSQDSEIDWRAAYRKADSNLSTGRIMKWSGVSMLGGGTALGIWGASSKHTTAVTVRSSSGSISYNYKESPNWAAIGVGAGMGVGLGVRVGVG